MNYATKDLGRVIGTQVEIDPAVLVDGSQGADLRRLLEARGVLVFRRINLSDDQQVRVASSLGTVREEGKAGIFKVSLDPKENANAEYLIGSFNWHMDGTHDDVPCLASLLSGRRLSPVGGQTEFANTYAAFEALPDTEKAYLSSLRVVHTLESSQRSVFRRQLKLRLRAGAGSRLKRTRWYGPIAPAASRSCSERTPRMSKGSNLQRAAQLSNV